MLRWIHLWPVFLARLPALTVAATPVPAAALAAALSLIPAAGCKDRPGPRAGQTAGSPEDAPSGKDRPSPKTAEGNGRAGQPGRSAEPPVANEIKQVRRGHIQVPADHARPDSARMDLYFERYMGPKSGLKPLIVLHGGPGNPMPIGTILRRSHLGRVLLFHYDILYFEQRGTGRSQKPEEKKTAFLAKNIRRYRMDQYVEDIETVRKHAFGENRKITVMGSSWGGYLGLAYALKHPRNLERVILGSFEATARSTTNVCANFDRTLTTAEFDLPTLRPVINAFRASVRDGKVIWHKGKKEQRVVLLTDLTEIMSPFAVKARYRKMAAMLSQILKGHGPGLKFLDSLQLDGRTRVTIGGSPAARATYCEALVNKDLLDKLLAQPERTLYCDNRAFLAELRKTCLAFSRDRSHFDVHHRLHDMKIPALVFAGNQDPLVPWQATARAAALMPGAAFLLVSGGHTPIKAGGRCFADAVDLFAQGKMPFNTTCLRQKR